MMLGGTADAVESTVKYYSDTKKDIEQFVYRHTDISQEEYKEHQKEEWYFNAETAKKLGVVDFIIGVDEE
jgi:ATP-dependent protease ClpP protease subunit